MRVQAPADLLLLCAASPHTQVYTPFCCLAVIEALSDTKSGVIDPFLYEVSNWG